MSDSRLDRRIGDPARALEWLEAVAQRWRRDGYRGQYVDALLQHANYVSRDAEHEADCVDTMLQPDYLVPFLLQGSSTSLAGLAERCREQAGGSGVFILGSGNSAVPLVLNTLVGLVLGKTLYVRPSSANLPALRVLWRALFGGEAGQPGSGQSSSGQSTGSPLELLGVSHRDATYFGTLASLPVSSAFLWGGHDAVEVTAACLPQVVAQRVHRLLPRTGVLVLEPSWWEVLGPDERHTVAQACYDHLLLYDAASCSSPTIGVALGEPSACRKMADELMALVTPHLDERERLARLAGANARRRNMPQWVSHGYTLHRARSGAGLLALGTLDDYRRKNHYLPAAPTFHDAAAALEVLCFGPREMGEAARFLATLQQEPRYRGNLWSIGHLIMMASGVTSFELREALDFALAGTTGARHLSASDLRVVDVRQNICLAPGMRFDGVSLLDAMLPPETSAPPPSAARERPSSWFPKRHDASGWVAPS